MYAPGRSALLPPLLLLLCLTRTALSYSPPGPVGCFREDIREWVPEGAERTSDSCTQLRCEDGRITELPCGLIGVGPDSGCRIEDGDPEAPYPGCCHHLNCPPEPGHCYREDTKEWVPDGTEWTGESCTRIKCVNGGIAGLPCGLIGVGPNSGCRIDDGDPAAPYPGCCPQLNCSACWAEELGRSVRVDEKWTLQGCSGQATCKAPGAVAAVGCPLMAVPPWSPCGLNDGDPSSDDYPRCCPRITCPDCYSESRQEHFGPGETWTEPGCLQQQCELSEDGRYAGVLNTPCASMQDPPYDGYCTRSPPAAGEFPACCPVYTCKTYCFSESAGKFFAIGDTWTEKDSCTRATCRPGPDGNAHAVLLPCPPPPPPLHDECFLTPVNSSAEFPDCCPSMECPEPSCFSEAHNRRYQVGETWTEPHCTRASCRPGGQIAALPCGLLAVQPGCTVVDGDETAEYPQCCPQLACY